MCGNWRVFVLTICGLASVIESITIDSSVQNTIETRVVVDKLAFANWKNDLTSSTDSDSVRDAETEEEMTTFIKAVFAGVNQIYAELDAYGINLDVRITDIQFIKDETISTEVYDGNRVSSNRVLVTFDDWLQTKPYSRVDHTLLFTGWDLSDGTQSHVLGVAFLGKMCHPIDSLSAVEIKRDGNTVLTLAHELGHSLGANHDGQGNLCSFDSMKIMDAGRTQNSTKNFKFSSCARTAIKRFLGNLYDLPTGSCLSAANTDTAALTSKQLGQLYDPDTICRMTRGPHSYFGRTFYGPEGALNYSRICTAIWCLDDAPYYASIDGTDGFPCGSGKECKLGQCISSNNVASTVSDSCTFGDAPAEVKVYNNQNCDELITASNSVNCYSDSIRRVCCGSCEAANTGIKGCEYGDKAAWCSTISAVDCYGNSAVCCKTCKKFETGIANCKYGDKNSGCASFIAVDRNRCNSNGETCCETCADPNDTGSTNTDNGSSSGTGSGTGTNTGSSGTGSDTGSSGTGTDTGSSGTGTDTGTSGGSGTDNGSGTASDAEPACSDSLSQCSTAIITNKQHILCYSAQNLGYCCASCKKASLDYAGISDCPYGDRNSACPSFIAANVNRCSRNRRVCCYSCRNYTG